MISKIEKLFAKKTITLILLLFIPLFTFLLAIPHLWDGDESIYAEISHQMFIKHDIVAPYYNYTELRFDKPPLNFWINVFFYHIFGMNEFSSRLGSALFGLLGVLLVYLLGKRLFNKRSGIIAALMLGTSFIYFIETQLSLIDTTLTFFITLSLYFFYIGYVEKKPLFLVLLGLPLGFGILTKGPVAIILTGGVGFVLFLFMTLKEKKRFTDLFNWQLLFGIILAMLICLPWYLAMWFRFGNDFIQSHFGYHMFKRFTSTIESHGGSQWYYYLYYILMLIIGFLPWSANLISAVKMGIQRRSEKNILFLFIWAGLIFLFFTISRTKLPGYVLPLLPPIVLLVGYWWDQILDDPKIHPNFWWGILLQLGGSLLLLIFILSQKSKIPSGYQDLFQIGLILPTSLVVGSLIAALVYLGKNKKTLFKTTFIVFYLFWLLFLLIVTQMGQSFQPVKELAADLKKYYHKNDRIVVNILGADSAPFYTGRHVTVVYDDLKIANHLNSKTRVFAMIGQKTLTYLSQNHIHFYIISKHGRGYLIANQKSE